MLHNYERGNMVQYGENPQIFRVDNSPFPIGLVVDAEYRVKSDDFLIFIMWPDLNKPQALLQKDCRKRGLKVIN